jgi:hypothetical protein
VADLLTPFFLGPSVGGPITDGGAGVPLGLGVLGVESEGASGLEGGAAGRVVDVAGDSLSLTGGVSSLTGGTYDGSTMARSFSDCWSSTDTRSASIWRRRGRRWAVDATAERLGLSTTTVEAKDSV